MKLPKKGWMALRRLGWTTGSADHVSDRVYRMAEEAAARLLRLADHRRQIVAGILATWPADPVRRTGDEWDVLWAAVPDGTSKVEVRNRTRQIAAYLDKNKTLPEGLCDLEGPPRVASQLLLAAADCQAVSLERAGPDRGVLQVQLPLVPHPRSRRDWVWLVLPVGLPVTVDPAAVLHTPTLRVVAGRVRVDLPHTIPITPAPRSGHVNGLGLDWGVNTFLVGALAKVVGDRRGRLRVLSDGRPLRYDPAGAVAKWHRLRQEGEKLRAKIKRVEALCGGWGPSVVDSKLEVLRAENDRLCARLRHLGSQVAWAGARWAVDQAIATGASVVYVENLASLEPTWGRKLNARISGSVRGIFHDALRHLAAKAGIAVVDIPARGTSAGCPRCCRPIGHYKTPQAARKGTAWAKCSHCGFSADRDHSAAERIVSRGLSSHSVVYRDRSTGRMSVRNHASTDTPVTCCLRRRDKTGPTPKRPSRSSVTRSASAADPSPTASRLVPLRRQVPSLSGSDPVGLKRPEGRAPKDGQQDRSHQGAGSLKNRTQPYRPPTRHRPRWTAKGAGFHRNAYATPTVVKGDWGPKAPGYATLTVA